jgi:hypothetical protein
MKPWDSGKARARAGRPLPSEHELQRDWGFTVWEARLFNLGHLEGLCGRLPAETREVFERIYEAMDRQDKLMSMCSAQQIED